HFGANSSPLTGEIPITVNSPVGEPGSTIVTAASGNALVAWTDFTLPGGAPQILARRFNSNGTPFTDPFAVSTNSAPRNDSPQVVMDAEGNATIAWNQSDTTGDRDVVMRRYPPGAITAP